MLRLLATQPVADLGTAEPGGRTDASTHELDDTAAMAPLDQTQLVPRMVEDLRGLGASESDDVADAPHPPRIPKEPTQYWARWLRRWKVSAVVAAWAVTTLFAFTTETSTFGPKEWLVGLLGSVILGGVLVGTLANFAVAAIPTRSRREAPQV